MIFFHENKARLRQWNGWLEIRLTNEPGLELEGPDKISDSK